MNILKNKIYVFGLGTVLTTSVLLRYNNYFKSLVRQNICQKSYIQEINFAPFLTKQDELDLLENLDAKKFEIIIKKYSEKLDELKFLEMSIVKNFQSENDLLKLSKEIHYSKGQNDLPSLTKAFSEPIWDLLLRGGKKVRPFLCILLVQCFGKKWEDILQIASIVECIHNGSLIVDDIEDNRREKKCVHLLYGIDISVNAGNFLYFGPIQQLIKQKKYPDDVQLKILQSYLDEMVNLHLGQAWDIFWHNSNKVDVKIPTQEQYFQMVSYKTGVMFRMIGKLVSVILDLPDNVNQKLCQFTERIGVAFQIQDDALNLDGSDQYKKGKGYLGEDIHEGKMSLMVILTVNQANEQDKQRILQILKMKTEDQTLINEAIQIMKKYKAIDQAREISVQLIEEAWNDIKNYIPDNKAKQILHALAKYVVARNF